MSNAAGSGSLQYIVIAIVGGIVYFLYPSGEDWMPLDLNSYRSTYFDRNTLSWSGNVVSLSTKFLNSDGSPIAESKWQLQGRLPQGAKIDLIVDCQQHRSQVAGMSIFLKEGEYAPVQLPAAARLNQVLDSANPGDQKLLGLCDSERPGWHPFRYRWFRSFFPSLSGPKA